MNILILGGGYAGLMTALRLGNRGLAGQVTLVNAAPDFVERVRHHQLGASTVPPRRSITRLLRGTGVRFVAGRVTRLDLDRRVARLVGGGELGFDRVVFALGSVGDAGAVPGVREHASVISDEAGALRLRAQLARGAHEVVVVGGGPTGIETAAELAEQGVGVTLVASPGVGGFLSPAGQWYLVRALAAQPGRADPSDSHVRRGPRRRSRARWGRDCLRRLCLGRRLSGGAAGARIRPRGQRRGAHRRRCTAAIGVEPGGLRMVGGDAAEARTESKACRSAPAASMRCPWGRTPPRTWRALSPVKPSDRSGSARSRCA